MRASISGTTSARTAASISRTWPTTTRCAAGGPRVIAGTHDLPAVGRLAFGRCSTKACYSHKRTRRRLAPESVAWLRALPANRLVKDSIALVRGGVRDVQFYMTTARHIRRNAELLREDFPTARVCFFGHSHAQKLYEVAGDEVRELAVDQPYHLSPDRLYFINAGSVDAQRKREEKLAEFAVLDAQASTVQFHRVRYDAAATEAKATAGGYRIPPFTDWIWGMRGTIIPT